MAKNKFNVESQKDQKEIEIQVHLTEYQKIREEILYQIGSSSQSLFLSLSSSSIVLPLLVNQANTISPIFLGSILYALSIIYSVIGMHYASAMYHVHAEANYIHQSLAQKVNMRLNTTSKNRVLQAENFLRGARRNFIALYLSTIGSVATSLIILMPALVTLLIAQYVFLLPSIQTFQTTLALQFLSSLMLPLSIISWIFFVLAVISQILNMFYVSMTSFIMPGLNVEQNRS